MKKRILFICMMCLFGFLALPCSAAEIPQEQALVYARCVDNSYIGHGADVQNGSASITMADGITITVSGLTESEVHALIVMPITSQTDGYKWFQQVLAKQADEIMPFDLYLVNQDGDKIATNAQFNVSITAPEGFAKPEAHWISTDGSTTNMNSTLVGGNITFTARGNGYYAVINRKDGATPPTTEVPQPGAGTQVQAPQTGEGNQMACALVWMLVAGLGVLASAKWCGVNKGPKH